MGMGSGLFEKLLFQYCYYRFRNLVLCMEHRHLVHELLVCRSKINEYLKTFAGYRNEAFEPKAWDCEATC